MKFEQEELQQIAQELAGILGPKIVKMAKKHKNQDEFLTTKEASEFLRIKKSFIRKLAKERKVPYLASYGRTFLFKKSDLAEWFDREKIIPVQSRRIEILK